MDDDIDGLYDLPPGEFTAARDALVKRLRAEKRRDDANAVKTLRRPTAAAWAVNQVARRHPEALAAVTDAGAQLVAAQRRVLSGIKDAGLQAAAARRRTAIDRAWQLAAAALQDQGGDAQAQRQAVVDTLEAASVDDEAADVVRAGRLTAPLPAPSDFGAVGGFALVPPADADGDGDVAGDADGTDDEDAGHADGTDDEDAANERRRQAEQAATAARGRADDAQRQAGDARQAAVRATAAAKRLREEAEQAARRAAAAEDDAKDADARAAALEAAAAEAADEAERLQAQAVAART